MSQIIIVEKSGAIKEHTIREFNEDLLYKKAGFKTGDGFEKQATWIGETYSINLYGKTIGKAGQENKYDFPPPVDNRLFFGNCILVNHSITNGPITNLTSKEWNSIYEELFGGFEDIGSEDSEDEDEDDDDGVERTKEGYVKDGFIVDDDEDADEEDEEEEEELDDDEESEDEDDMPKKRRKSKKKVVKLSKKTPSKKKAQLETIFKAPTETFLDCTSELSEEEYFT